MKKDLEDIRNGAGDVRAFRHIDGHINSVEDYSKHPEGCTCGHCGKDHDHKTMGHVPKHTHGDACGYGHDHDHDSHGCGENCGCGEHEHEHFVVDLEDDNGNVLSCPIVDAFEFEENEYVLAQNPEDESVYLFRSTEEGELIVPEEAEFDKVTEYYTNVLAED